MKHDEYLRENYHAITAGWGYEDGLTVADSKKGKRCVLCSCECTGGWKKGKHMHTHVRKLLTMIYRCVGHCTCDQPIKMHSKPTYPDISLGLDSVGPTMAGHQKCVDARTVMIEAWFEQVASSPEEFSPVVLFEEITSAYVGRRLEVRWTVENSYKEKDYLQCSEGGILEIISYSANRPTYQDFRSCKYDVAKVKWDPEFNMEDSHVPLNPDRYAKKTQHLGVESSQ